MDLRLKERQSPNSTILSQTDSTLRQNSKRFTRSNSGSRSKSKDQPKDTQTRKFFVKNICKDLLLDKSPDSKSLLMKLEKQKNKQPSLRRKRVDTPVKERREMKKAAVYVSSFQGGLEKELQMLQVEKMLKEVRADNQRLKSANKMLEHKLDEVSLRLAEIINHNCFLQEKIKYFQQKDRQTSMKEGRSSALTKIKKIIASTKDSCEAIPPVEKLEQTNRQLQADNNRLKEALKTAESSVQKMRISSNQMVNQRQNFLNDLVQQLKLQLTEKEEMLLKMRIQLNIFLVRQAKSSDISEQLNLQQMSFLKKKYVRVLKMYHEVTQQLAAFKRKNQRMNCLFPNSGARKRSTDSLTFSP